MTERRYQKIGRIREYLTLLERLKDDCEEQFRADPIYRGALLHYLYLMADTCIALAEVVIKERSLRPPQSYHDAIEILGEAGILRRDFAFSFARIAGFRNFLAHDYELVDSEQICREILGQLDEVEDYLQQMEK